MQKRIIFSLLAVTTLALSGCGTITMPSPTPSQTTSATSDTTSASNPPAGSYSLSDIAQHATSTDCWMAVSGKVYNVTGEIGKHPGGEAILQGCGKDATQLFFDRPGEGTPHSNRAQQMLTQYYIGELKN